MTTAIGGGQSLRRRGRQLLSAAAWLGGTSRGERLPDRTVVVSPHLDDAILSLGAAISSATRAGASITVLTVLAGDPDSRAAAGDWDGPAGFRTAGDAARLRREEDRYACDLVGATAAWLPFADHQYARREDDETIAASVLAAVDGASAVLLPGFPLMHEDHVWLDRLLTGRDFGPACVGRYVEQPYAALWTAGVPTAHGGWTVLPASLPDRVAKLRASSAYTSQLPLLAPHPVRRVARYEAVRGGEEIAWIDRT